MVNKGVELKKVDFGVNYTLYGKLPRKDEEVIKKVELNGGFYGSSPTRLHRMSTIDYAKISSRYNVNYPPT
jgi:hypothetical protein